MTPIKKIKFKNFSIAIWERTGDKGKFYTATLERRFQNKNSQEWESERVNFLPDQMLVAAELLRAGFVATQDLHNNTPTNNTVYDDVPY